MRANPKPADEQGEVAALLRELLARFDRLEARLEGRKPASTEADAELVLRIFTALAGKPFYAYDALDYLRPPELPEAAGLRAAVVAALGPQYSARRLGKRLKALEGADLAGLRVERIGQDREGTLWAIVEVWK